MLPKKKVQKTDGLDGSFKKQGRTVIFMSECKPTLWQLHRIIFSVIPGLGCTGSQNL